MLASRKLIRCFPTLLDVAGNNSVTSSPGSGGLRTGVTANRSLSVKLSQFLTKLNSGPVAKFAGDHVQILINGTRDP